MPNTSSPKASTAAKASALKTTAAKVAVAHRAQVASGKAKKPSTLKTTPVHKNR